MTEPWDIYHQDAAAFFGQYEALPFESLHGDLLGYLPQAPGAVLDVGAGSGRDAAWFAGAGFEVVALEPAEALRALGRAAHASPRIQWLPDRLPDLETVSGDGRSFDLVWVAGVWMHVPPEARGLALRNLAMLLKPGGRAVFTLRQGPTPPGRSFHPVSPEALEAGAARHGWSLLGRSHSEDVLGREGVTWHSLVFQAPEGGRHGSS